MEKERAADPFISDHVVETPDVPKVTLEAGNSPQIIFRHYGELVEPKEVRAWFGIEPATARKVPITVSEQQISVLKPGGPATVPNDFPAAFLAEAAQGKFNSSA